MRWRTLRELLTMLERDRSLPSALLKSTYREVDPFAVAWACCDDAAVLVWALQLPGELSTDTIELLVERGVRPKAFVRCAWWERPVQRDRRVCWAVRLVVPALTLSGLVSPETGGSNSGRSRL